MQKEQSDPFIGGCRHERQLDFRSSGFAARAGSMLEADGYVFNSSCRSGEFRCRPNPRVAGVGPFTPIGVGCGKCTGNDGVKHASRFCHGGRETICRCERSKRALRKKPQNHCVK
jgi:hypothetical protein